MVLTERGGRGVVAAASNMADESGQVTMIFYKLNSKWWTEPFLNIVAAAAQMSTFTHVEIAIGTDAGAHGEMANVCRVFNDSTGVELTARTGRNPQYSYIQLGCSKKQEIRMLGFARSCVGKPFSGMAMARSVIYPRKTNNSTFFCAELVAAVLKEGGMLDPISNPGAATPESLHDLYKGRATTTANPYVLRQASCQRQLTTNTIGHQRLYTPPRLLADNVTTLRHNNNTNSGPPRHVAATVPVQSLSNSTYSGSVKSSLRVLNAGPTRGGGVQATNGMGLTLNSLNFRK